MKRHVLACLVVVVATVLVATTAFAQSKPEFQLGFKALADQIPTVAGQPIEVEHYGPNGDSLQQTTTGLMVWRKSDNFTCYTNGSRSWINGPLGVQERANDERFSWEATQPAPTAAPTPAPQLAPVPAPSSGVVQSSVVLIVNSVQRVGQVSSAWVPKPGNNYLVADITIQSVALTDLHYNPLDFSAKASDGYQYNTTTAGGSATGMLTYGHLGQGEIVRGRLNFEVPANAGGFTLLYEYSFGDAPMQVQLK